MIWNGKLSHTPRWALRVLRDFEDRKGSEPHLAQLPFVDEGLGELGSWLLHVTRPLKVRHMAPNPSSCSTAAWGSWPELRSVPWHPGPGPAGLEVRAGRGEGYRVPAPNQWP